MPKYVPNIDDITQTAGYKEAMEDIKHGRVTSASSVDDLFNQILGENWRNVFAHPSPQSQPIAD